MRIRIFFSVFLSVFSVLTIAHTASTGNDISRSEASKHSIKKTGFSAIGGRWNIKKIPSAASKALTMPIITSCG